MRQTKEILRQKWVHRRSHRDIVRIVGVSLGAVSGVLERAQAAGIEWAQVEALTEEALEARLYTRLTSPPPDPTRSKPDCAWIHRERRRPGVTLELLHQEYLEQHPTGYKYSQFCEFYRRWLARSRTSMRQVHVAGEKAFVDYAGMKPHIVDPVTGECIDVELFLMVLGASNHTYAEATRTQSSPDWIASNTRGLEFLGGVPGALVPDQLKSAVTTPCRYEPGVQRTYEDFAEHYGTVVLPARPKKPKDKAKVEVGVQIAERWILARLRNQTFFSLAELNERIAELLVQLNDKRMKVYGASRRELFEQLDRPALKPLPSARYEYAQWLRATVNIDSHIEAEHHYYSAPHTLKHEVVDVRMTSTTVEVLFRGERVAVHRRSHERGRHTTIAAHLPVAHQKHLAWSPSRIIAWGATIGPSVKELVAAILDDRPHPEQGYRSCLGIIRLAKRYGNDRLDAACRRALHGRLRSYRSVESMLKHGLDREPLPEQVAPARPVVHENIRGPSYYN